jgi:serine/threonine protein phosphatase PrpC
VDEALRAGSTDNITAVVVAVTGALAKPNVTTGVGLASSAEAPPAAGAGKI